MPKVKKKLIRRMGTKNKMKENFLKSREMKKRKQRQVKRTRTA